MSMLPVKPSCGPGGGLYGGAAMPNPADSLSPVDRALYEEKAKRQAQAQAAYRNNSIGTMMSVNMAAPAPNLDIRIVIHPTANGHTVVLSNNNGQKEWVCPDGASIVDIIAVALAEFSLTK